MKLWKILSIAGAGGAILGGVIGFVGVKLTGPPNGGIDDQTMLEINWALHEDLKACNDTISTLRGNLAKWRIERH